MSALSFPFHPWVRSTCRTALRWGAGALLVVVAATALLRRGHGQPLGHAFTVLGLYGGLFLATLLKIWWSAGRPVVELEASHLSYRLLHHFGVRRVAYERILACSPRPGTQSLRLVVAQPNGTARELFLNLAVVHGSHAFLRELGSRLEASGLEPLAGAGRRWARRDWLAEDPVLAAESSAEPSDHQRP